MEAGAQLRDSISQRIEEVVVTARGRNRARKYFRRYVRKVPLQGWYVGYTGAYRIDIDALEAWRSHGDYERNHIPGDDANRRQIALFKVKPAAAADSVNSWRIQRYILLASSIAERAATLGYRDDATLSYRGLDEGMNIFLISEPRIDRERSFRTRILVDNESGLIAQSESVSMSPSGAWNVTADYALFDEFLYPLRVAAIIEQKDPYTGETETVRVEMTGITPRRFQREENTGNLWENNNDPSKVLKKKVRDKLLRMR